MLEPARCSTTVAVALLEVPALRASAQRLLLWRRTPAPSRRVIAVLVLARVTTRAPTVAREAVALVAVPQPLATSLPSVGATDADLPPHPVGAVVLCPQDIG